MGFKRRISKAYALLTVGLLVLLGFGAFYYATPPDRTLSVQTGFRGTGMGQVYEPNALAQSASLHSIPEPEPVDDPEPDAPTIAEVYKNVLVLNDLTVLEFSRLMNAMSTWVAPEAGCSYCHNTKNLASDEKYTKIVARRMLQMTRKINTDWKQHVQGTGVTCWTCHRGQGLPSGDWWKNEGFQNASSSGSMGYNAGQNTPGQKANGNTSLPFDALSEYLSDDKPIRVQGTQALAGENRRSVKQAEWTYSLMIYMSNSLGVNCTYCHNTRALASWPESSPARATAWYGIRMVRDVNNNYVSPLTPILPAYRLGTTGDGPKVGCETCHKGAYKPLYGVSMLDDYPVLRGVMVRPPPGEVVPPAADTPASAPGVTAAKAGDTITASR